MVAKNSGRSLLNSFFLKYIFLKLHLISKPKHLSKISPKRTLNTSTRFLPPLSSAPAQSSSSDNVFQQPSSSPCLPMIDYGETDSRSSHNIRLVHRLLCQIHAKYVALLTAITSSSPRSASLELRWRGSSLSCWLFKKKKNNNQKTFLYVSPLNFSDLAI